MTKAWVKGRVRGGGVGGEESGTNTHCNMFVEGKIISWSHWIEGKKERERETKKG